MHKREQNKNAKQTLHMSLTHSCGNKTQIMLTDKCITITAVFVLLFNTCASWYSCF